jgi:hypothetical protein
MNTNTKVIANLMLAAALSFGTLAAQALDCGQVANNAAKLYTAKASKNQAVYTQVKKGMLAESDHKKIYSMLVRAVDDGLYSSPDAMHKAALRYCTRKLAAN